MTNEKIKNQLALKRFSNLNVCPECGTKNVGESNFCKECGIDLNAKKESLIKERDIIVEEKKIKTIETRKDPGFAGVFSAIVPGLGQIYNEQILKGVVLFVLSIITILILIICLIQSFLPSDPSSDSSLFWAMIIFFCIYLVLWLIGVYDAQGTAININEQLK